MTRNLKLTLAYDGSEYKGWQVQPGLATVQGTLSEVIGRLTGEKVLPQGSGRTDAGVHALAQVATFATESPIPVENLQIILNDRLPPSIRVLAVEEVAPDFHARHSAIGKTYEYRIFRGPVCPPFLFRYATHHPYPLDEDAMFAAAEHVVGEHDFTSFAAVDPDRETRECEPGCPTLNEVKGGTVKGGTDTSTKYTGCPTLNEVKGGIGTSAKHATNIRTIYESRWRRSGDEIIYTVRGNGFLHHMVRNLVGTFLLVGKGTLAPDGIDLILAERDRSAAGATAPASGLYLVAVEYP